MAPVSATDLLPLEVWHLILRFIHKGKHVARFGAVCRDFYDMTRARPRYLVKALGLKNAPEELRNVCDHVKKALRKQRRFNNLHLYHVLSARNDADTGWKYEAYQHSFLAALRYVKGKSSLNLTDRVFQYGAQMVRIAKALRNTQVVRLGVIVSPPYDRHYESDFAAFLEEIPHTNLSALRFIVFYHIPYQTLQLLLAMMKMEQFRQLSIDFQSRVKRPLLPVYQALKYSRISHLSLNQQMVYPAHNGCWQVMRCLQEIPGSPVKSLWLTRYWFRNSHMRKLAGFLRTCSTLRKLNFTECTFFGFDLKKQDFGDKETSELFFRALAQSSVEHLSFRESTLPISRLPQRKNLHRQVTSLDLSYRWKEKMADVFEHIVQHRHIRRLSIKNSNLDVGRLDVLRCIRDGNLDTVDFSGNTGRNFTDAFWTAVTKSPVKCIRLRNCHLDGASVGDLCRVMVNSNLRKVDLAWNYFDVHDINALRNAQSLSSVDILDLRFQKFCPEKHAW